MNSGRYGRLFARDMQFRRQRRLHLEQVRYQLTDKIEKRQFAARPTAVGLCRADRTTPTEANFFGYNHSEARRSDNRSDTGHLAGNPD
jgi:hypothetical protein